MRKAGLRAPSPQPHLYPGGRRRKVHGLFVSTHTKRFHLHGGRDVQGDVSNLKFPTHKDRGLVQRGDRLSLTARAAGQRCAPPSWPSPGSRAVPRPAARGGVAAQHAGTFDDAKQLPHLSARRQTECGRVCRLRPFRAQARPVVVLPGGSTRTHTHACTRLAQPALSLARTLARMLARTPPHVFCRCVRTGVIGVV